MKLIDAIENIALQGPVPPDVYQESLRLVLDAAEKWDAYLYCNPMHFNENGRNKYIDEIMEAYKNVRG